MPVRPQKDDLAPHLVVDAEDGRESERLRVLLEEGAPIRVAATAGPPTSGLAPIFSIYDQMRREIVLLGADGDDAVFQFRTLGVALRMDRPSLRFPDAFRGVRPGDELRIAVARRGRGWCMQVNGARDCSLGLTVADTWTVLLFASGLFTAARVPLGALWLALLFLPGGLWVRGRREALAACAAAAAGLFVVPWIAGLLPTPAWGFAAALGGLAAGALVRRAASRHISRQETS
ncbi:MAG TPA: hypothetical protein VHG51_00870 [Longimicrobiaceae bacterium]|nr:hypothetical protein [Longimicrobiaceae bacterium]